MLNCYGMLRIPNNVEFQKTKWKDGYYLSFKAFSIENDKQHNYRCNMYVPREDISKWEEEIKPGRIFFLKNGKVGAYTQEDWKNSIYTIKIKRQDLMILRVKPDTGEKDE